jgi:RHS repeat-associated protein
VSTALIIHEFTSGVFYRHSPINYSPSPIATRVSGDPETTNNGLFYIHSDHLGSATFLTHGNGHASEGLKKANSTKFFTPFGEYRIDPPDPADDITDRGFTGHKHNDDIELIYMNARYYVPAIGRFASADTVIPHPNDPQSYNRFSYVRNNPLNSVDPTGHIDCPDPDAGCDPPQNNQTPPTSGTIVYYLNGIGGDEYIEPRDLDETRSEYSYVQYVLQEIYGEANVFHIPLYTDGATGWAARAQMVGEALGSEKPWTYAALEFILANPPSPGQEVVIVGSSAGGTVAVELLELLEAENIFVDILILRGSFVMENSLTNVGEVHYLAGDPPLSDIYYSVDINPFDGVVVQQHIVPGLDHHNPRDTDNPKQALENIGFLIKNILTD